MAIFRFTSTASWPALDMDVLQGNLATNLFSYGNFSATATRLRLFESASDSTSFTGSGLRYQIADGRLTDVTAGTFQAMEIRVGGVAALTVTGLSMSAAGFADFVFAGNSDSAFDLLVSGNDSIFGGVRGDRLVGGDGADTISGNGGGDELIGALKNDRLFGGAGADLLRGGSQNDWLSGGAGLDRLRGGGDNDSFVFDAPALAANADVIEDFTVGADRIALQNDVLAGLGAAGALRAAQFHLGTAAADASDRIIVDRSTGRIWLDRDGQGGAAKVLLAEVADGTALTAGSFLIF